MKAEIWETIKDRMLKSSIHMPRGDADLVCFGETDTHSNAS